jgi:hypothetical protein
LSTYTSFILKRYRKPSSNKWWTRRVNKKINYAYYDRARTKQKLKENYKKDLKKAIELDNKYNYGYKYEAKAVIDGLV